MSMPTKPNPADSSVQEIATILAKDIVRHLDMRHVACRREGGERDFGGLIGSVFPSGAYCTRCMRMISNQDEVMILGVLPEPIFTENPFGRQ